MKSVIKLLAVVAIFFAANANAQDHIGWNGGGGHNQVSTVIFRCDSNSYQTATCAIPLRRVRDAYLYRQVSKSTCSEGYSYFISDRYITVSRGCRAEFLARGIR